MLRRHDGDNWEKSRLPVHWKFSQQRPYFVDEPGDIALRNKLAIHLNSFRERNQVRRRKKPGAQAGRAINAFEHRAGRTFAVGAGDMDKAKFFVWISRQRGEFESILQAEPGSK